MDDLSKERNSNLLTLDDECWIKIKDIILKRTPRKRYCINRFPIITLPTISREPVNYEKKNLDGIDLVDIRLLNIFEKNSKPISISEDVPDQWPLLLSCVVTFNIESRESIFNDI